MTDIPSRANRVRRAAVGLTIAVLPLTMAATCDTSEGPYQQEQEQEQDEQEEGD